MFKLVQKGFPYKLSEDITSMVLYVLKFLKMDFQYFL